MYAGNSLNRTANRVRSRSLYTTHTCIPRSASTNFERVLYRDESFEEIYSRTRFFLSLAAGEMFGWRMRLRVVYYQHAWIDGDLLFAGRHSVSRSQKFV